MTAVLPDELTRDNTKDIAKNDEFFENVLGKIKARQWTLADFDWDKPGADTINPEQFDDLKQFMSDLVWIEHIGGRMMGTLGITAPNDTLREIYSYFHAEEQRHANAEIALMRRWGMLAEEIRLSPGTSRHYCRHFVDSTTSVTGGSRSSTWPPSSRSSRWASMARC